MTAARPRRQRARGDGSIWQETDGGRWRWAVSLPEGRRKGSAGSRDLAARALRDAQRDAAAGQLEVARPPTVGEWLEHWLTSIAPARLRPHTLTGYRGYVAKQIVPTLGARRLDRLTVDHVEAWHAVLLGRGLAPATVVQAHRILSRAVTVAVQRGRVGRNVLTLVSPPSVRRAEIRPLTAVEARRVVKAAAGRRNGARWQVALALGLRQGEALGLRWADVDLTGGTVTVRRALQRQAYAHGCADPAVCGTARSCPARTGGGLVMVEPKSDRSRRTVSLPGQLVRALKAHRLAQRKERIAAGTSWADGTLGDLLWRQPGGAPVSPEQDWRDWRELLGVAGAPLVRPHDARHTAATLLLAQGVPLRVVMDILGHSQISLTANTYTHVVDELRDDAAKRIGGALWG